MDTTKLNNVHIAEYVTEQLEAGTPATLIAEQLDTTPAMVSKYKNRIALPSLTTAKQFYISTGIVLHPYDERSLLYEIKKG